MASMDIFQSNAFSMVSLTSAFEKVDFKPQLLGSLGLFRSTPIRTRTAAIERRNGFLSLVPTTPVGAPPTELENDKRDIRDVRTVRIAKGDTLYAEEVQNIRAFGSESELVGVQAEIMRRGARIRDDLELTHEHMRLGALQGTVVDADGASVLQDWFTTFGISPPGVIDWELDQQSPVSPIRQKCHDLVRSMARAAKGAFGTGTTIHALVGDKFYDKLVMHPEVEKTYLNWAAAADLRQNTAFGAFQYGGITWHNYRGTDDESTVAVASDAAHFFPVGATDMFEVAFAPAEFGPYVNTPGRELYVLSILDRDRQAYVRTEMYSYPLYICKRPEVLRTGIADAATA